MKIMTVVGARPQFVKAATLSRAIGAHPGPINEFIVHTGQHYDDEMSRIFFEELEIPAPRYSLGIHGGAHGEMTGRMLEALERVAVHENPNVVLVYGDTNSTLAGALAATKLHIPVVHVEAGLRSFNRRMPEEINRILTDKISTILLCPTIRSVENLSAEGITEGVHHIGDVMYDAMLHTLAFARTNSKILARLNLEKGGYCVATVHRAENTDDPTQLRKIISYIRKKAEKLPVVLPLHPRTRGAVAAAGLDLADLTVCEPLGYLDMTLLLSESAEIVTDSGGLQKEAYFHRKPCVTLRAETEWTETLECGWNRLWEKSERYLTRRDIDEYGSGAAAELAVSIIVRTLK